ncbi:MAG: HAD-IA family hydrolase [Spirochaetia bacterium]|nr:HAD-IA family hydrolase [Spirochaetia bacterium]
MKKKLSLYEVIFWDFDGVIKESNGVKSQAYRALFKNFGDEVQDKVEKHHLENGGISRFKKIPYYYSEFAKKTLSVEEIQGELERYRILTLDAVVECSWVPGVLEYLQSHSKNQKFFIVTGTPQEDIEIIVKRLSILDLFIDVYGAPDSKSTIVGRILNSSRYKKENCLFIGDAMTDYEAACNNEIDFLLRDTVENKHLFKDYNGSRFSNFNVIS